MANLPGDNRRGPDSNLPSFSDRLQPRGRGPGRAGRALSCTDPGPGPGCRQAEGPCRVDVLLTFLGQQMKNWYFFALSFSKLKLYYEMAGWL
eukprot:755381-Hanusia_phi.AAC.4